MPIEQDDDTDDGSSEVVSAPGSAKPVTLTPPEPEDDADDIADDDVPDDGGDPTARAVLQQANKDRQQQQQRPDRPGSPGSRKERRNLYRQTADLKTTVQSLREQLQRLPQEYERRITDLRDQILSRMPQQGSAGQPGGQQQDPVLAELADVDAGLAQEIRLMRQHDPDRGDYDLSRYNKLTEKKHRLMVRAELAQMGITPEQLQRQQQQQRVPYGTEVQRVVRYQALAAEFPWVTQGDAAARVGAYRNYLLQSGRPDNQQTDREAAMHVANEMGIGRRPPRPTQLQMQRRGGIPFADSETGNRRPPRQITVDANLLEGTGLSHDQIQRAVYSDE